MKKAGEALRRAEKRAARSAEIVSKAAGRGDLWFAQLALDELEKILQEAIQLGMSEAQADAVHQRASQEADQCADRFTSKHWTRILEKSTAVSANYKDSILMLQNLKKTHPTRLRLDLAPPIQDQSGQYFLKASSHEADAFIAVSQTTAEELKKRYAQFMQDKNRDPIPERIYESLPTGPTSAMRSAG